MKTETAKLSEKLASRLVTAPVLLRELFPDKECRRTRRWLDRMRAKRIIPYFKIGHGVYYDLEQVRETLNRNNLVRAL